MTVLACVVLLRIVVLVSSRLDYFYSWERWNCWLLLYSRLLRRLRLYYLCNLSLELPLFIVKLVLIFDLIMLSLLFLYDIKLLVQRYFLGLFDLDPFNFFFFNQFYQVPRSVELECLGLLVDLQLCFLCSH